MDSVLAYLRELNIVSMMLRILLAALTGGLIGLDRERKRQPAGFRTYMLVSIGAAVTILISLYYDEMLSTVWAQQAAEVGARHDVSRLGAQVINGVGFLGAGTIIVVGHQQVKGLTTAAGLWASACMGLAVGAGFYECVLMCFLLIFLSMRFLPYMEERITQHSRNMNVHLELAGVENFGSVANTLRSRSIRIYDVDINKSDQPALRQVACTMSVYLPKKTSHIELLAELSTVRGVIQIEEI